MIDTILPHREKKIKLIPGNSVTNSIRKKLVEQVCGPNFIPNNFWKKFSLYHSFPRYTPFALPPLNMKNFHDCEEKL